MRTEKLTAEQVSSIFTQFIADSCNWGDFKDYLKEAGFTLRDVYITEE